MAVTETRCYILENCVLMTLALNAGVWSRKGARLTSVQIGFIILIDTSMWSRKGARLTILVMDFIFLVH